MIKIEWRRGMIKSKGRGRMQKKDGKEGEKEKVVEDKKKGMEKDKKRWRKINETRESWNCHLSLSRYLLLLPTIVAEKIKRKGKIEEG